MANEQDRSDKGFATQSQAETRLGTMHNGMSSDTARQQGQNVNIDDLATGGVGGGPVNNKQQQQKARQQETKTSPNRTAEGETSSSSIESDDRGGNPTGPADT